jgi:hypothetical protein
MPKDTEVTLLAITSTAADASVAYSSVDVLPYIAGDVRVRMGRGTGTVFTVAPKIRIQKTYATSPTANQWVDALVYTCQLGVATIGSTAVSGTEAAGQTVISLTSGTNFTAGDYIFFHNTTIGNSEWSWIVSKATNDITVQEAIVNAQTGATCRNQAEQFNDAIDLKGVQKLRVVVDGAGSGQAVIVEVGMGAFRL